jgi:hypothetical protein
MSKFYYWGPLLFQTEINNSDIDKIKNLCFKDSKKNFQKELAGHIKEEYEIDKKELIKIISIYIEDYVKNFIHFYNKNITKFEIVSSWVNYMKAGEFNPPHTHGNDLSCVIYLDIPEKLKIENKNYIGTLKKYNGGPGAICFTCGQEVENFITNVTIFPEKGDFFIFPSNLTHFVYPFKSNVERISVSANFNIL